MLRPTAAATLSSATTLAATLAATLAVTIGATLSSATTLAVTIGVALVTLALPPLMDARHTTCQPAILFEARCAQVPPKLPCCPTHARRHAAVKGEQ